jgi:glycosyltransferase involved in cell wall biosynthesis
VKDNRNLDSLIEVQRTGRYQVWIVGSESESRPEPWRTRLEAAGCRVHTQFVLRIQEVYQAAEIYVFTVKALPSDQFPRHYHEIGAVDLPLSILEAMGCGLPVVSTRQDAVEHFLGGVPGLLFFDGTGPDCVLQLDALQRQPIATRPAAERFDLVRMTDQLGAFYQQVATEMDLT